MNRTAAHCDYDLSAYLDGTMTGIEMQAVCAHLDGCAACAAQFAGLREMQHLLATVGAAKAPEDLGLKLRVAISHANARRTSRWRDTLSVRWDNRMRPALQQYSAGLAAAVVLIGSVILAVSVVAAPEAVLAHDVPLGALTQPHYLYSAAPAQPLVTPEDTTIVIQADIDAAGEVYDYKILSGPTAAQVEDQVRNELMLQRYEPARVFGEPVRGRVLITFAGASVRG